MIETTISCIGSAYKQPIADLIINLHRRRVAWAYMEKEYAIPIILLTVAMFEAYMARAAYLALPDDQKSCIPLELNERVVSGNPKTGREIFNELYPDYSFSVEVDEVYVLCHPSAGSGLAMQHSLFAMRQCKT